MRTGLSRSGSTALATSLALGLALAPPALGQTVVLPDIVVAADRAPTDAARTGATVSVVTAEDVARQARPFALDYLTQLPGMRVAQHGPPGTISDIFVRGQPQRYVRVLVDGIEISDPTAPQVAPSLSGILAGDLARAEVLKGSQSAVWGGQAIGGVVALTTARPERDGVEHRLSAEAGRYSTARGAYTLAARTARSDVALTLQRFRTDGFSAAERRDGNTEPDGYRTTRLSASGAFYATDTVRLFGSAFHQREDGEQDGSGEVAPGIFGPVDADERFETRTWGLRAGAEVVTGALISTVSASRFDVDRQVFDPDGALAFGSEGDRTTVDYRGRIAVAPGLDVQVGADYAREEATFLASAFAPRIDASSSIAGAFAQTSWTPADPLTLGLALRRDEHSEFGGHTTGRLTAAYAPATDTIVRASLGTGFRPPSLSELFGQFGNPGLEPETSLSYDLGIEQRLLEGRARIAATLFRIEIDDIIGFAFPDGYLQTDGTARSRGVELAGAWDAAERVTLTAAYTYTDAELPDGSRQVRVPRHDAVLGLEVRPTDRLAVAATVQRVADAVDGAPVPGQRDILGEYTLVNARAAYAVTDRAELYLRAENLFDEQYQTVRGYGTSDRAFYFGVTGRF